MDKSGNSAYYGNCFIAGSLIYSGFNDIPMEAPDLAD